ncbi:MAG: type II toxin-antitoxin system PemK/MazF family toxin [Dysgonamonadaceae bacterium]|jgi:mRNA interferase MazF|nr:type II toxin-antitoxin system PemK/MazF family toxin [Dysgonamonadaceae bacterium]
MTFEQYEIWLADLNPRIGTEAGKVRPVLVVQTNLLNCIPHSSVLICPITTNVVRSAVYLRVHLEAGTSSLSKDCDIMIDQIRAIDARRLIRLLGKIPAKSIKEVSDNLRIIMDL